MFKRINKNFDRDICKFVSVEYSVESKKSYGGTSRENVLKMIREAKKN